MAQALLCFSLFILFYVYLGYPLTVAALATVRRREVRKSRVEPTVTILIAAHNEEEAIAATIENKLKLDYPAEKLQIMVISDGSTDGTDAIVERYAGEGVLLLRQDPRGGKTSALNLALPHATGEIIVFADGNSLYAPDALRRMVENFADPQVGYVTGRLVYANPEGTLIGEGCSAYMKYESALRVAESTIGSVAGVNGGIDAVRASLYRPMRGDLLPDLVLPLRVIEQGYRVVFEPRALLCETSLKEGPDEYHMRVRVSLRAFWALYEMRNLLFWRVDPLFCWQLWSHKLLRYLSFLFLLLSYLSNAVLVADGRGYAVLFLAQNALYLTALSVPLLDRMGVGGRLFTFTRYFCLLQAAAGHACAKFVLGKKQVVWAPRKG